MPPIVWIAIAIVAGIFALIFIAFLLQFLGLWIQATTSNAKVSLIDMIGMRFRKVDLRTVVINRIRAVKSGMDIPTNAIETHYLAGGRVNHVISAMIAARGARIELPWNIATAIDLAGRDILDAVQTSVNPKVIDCPAGLRPPRHDRRRRQGRHPAQVQGPRHGPHQHRPTRRRCHRGDDHRPRRPGHRQHHRLLRGPQAGAREPRRHLSKTVMASGLDAGTAFEILSIDIADIDVGDNIGAKLQTDQANANKQMAQAEAEKRRALAVAQEQEFKAEEQKNRALVVLSEAEVPKAISEAFRSGRLGVMDYYKMQNMQADTNMRGSIAGDGNKS